MNLLKLQDQLKGLPDDALVQYVQNPSGQVPTYLALSELERRKSMREQYKAEQGQAPESTVAEDLTQNGGLAGLANVATPQAVQQPQPTMAQDQATESGLAAMDTGEMFNEENYATGGIVAFAKGGEPKKSYPYEYDYEKYYDQPNAALVAVPSALDLPALQQQQLDAYRLFGVDPKFFEKQIDTEKTESAKELAEARKMGQANILFKLAEGIGTTPGSLMRGIAASGGKAGEAVGEMAKTEAALKRASRDAIQKNQAAQYAQSVGDAKGAMVAMEERNKAIREAQTANAKLETDMRVAGVAASSRLRAAGVGKDAEIRSKVYDKAIKTMEQMYGPGAFETLFQKNNKVAQQEFNRHVKAAESYISRGEMPTLPASKEVMNLLGVKGVQPKASTKVAPHINNLLNKYAPLSASEDEED